ncbi:MAG: biotin transporter BioY [Acidobacteriaceae bacterium]
MTNFANTAVSDRRFALLRTMGLVIGASLFIAVCARLSLPLPFTPVPLSLANFGVLAVGLVLGSRRGFAACIAYLMMGAAGLPVLSPFGSGGFLHLFGPTGGYLLAYPVVAYIAGMGTESSGFGRKLVSSIAAELFLFACGVSWLMVLAHVPFAKAAAFGLYPFVFFEGMKVMGAAGMATKFKIS